MDKNTVYAGYLGPRTLTSAALSMLLAANTAASQDLATTGRISSSYNGYVTINEESLVTNFEDRWSGVETSEKEFVLGANGVVTKGGAEVLGATASNDAGAKGHHIDAAVSAYFDVSERATGRIEPVQTPTLDTTSSDTPENLGAGTPVGECGPSPLSPDEIKALVASTARRYSVDEGFAVAIAWAESRFDEIRNSPKGARGPMQLIPETAARFGVQDICDPAQNIEGGMKYLRFLLDEFQNPLLVAAAYNSGEGRIYEYGGVPPFQETVGYVAKVVNFQLGLPMPTGKRKASGIVRDMAEKNTSDAGVIAVEKTGKFVGGVMHF